MPRRKTPREPIAVAWVDLTARKREIRGVIGKEAALAALSPQVQDALADQLVHASGFAQAGLRPVLAGKRVKPLAWTLDILVADVCQALKASGVPVAMNPTRSESLAQRLAFEVAAAAGLRRGAGELFKQMQRSRHIARQELPIDIVLLFQRETPLLTGVSQK